MVGPPKAGLVHTRERGGLPVVQRCEICWEDLTNQRRQLMTREHQSRNKIEISQGERGTN